MTDLDHPFTSSLPVVAERPGPLARLLLWWDASCEIAELTRDREREERIIAAGAAQLMQSPGALGLLFRPKPRRR